MTMPDHQELTEMYREHKYHELISYANQSSFAPQDSPRSTNAIAAAYFSLGKYEECFALLEAVEGALSSDPNFLSLFGATCRRLGMLERAKDLLETALQIDSGSRSTRNNYANILIDLGDNNRASIILKKLVEEDPGYADAQENLNRILFRKTHSQPEPLEQASGHDATKQYPVPSRHLSDPVLVAFSKDEIESSNKKYKVSAKVSVRLLQRLLQKLPIPNDDSIASDELRLAGRLINEGDVNRVLTACSRIHRRKAQPSSLNYITASDAYIRMRRFREAEICLLHGLALGSPSLNIYINLSSLAAMRKDLKLAWHYLDAAASIDPQSQELSSLRESLEQQALKSKESHYRFDPQWIDSTTLPKANH